MTMLVVSDIHGALDGAHALLEALQVHQIERILCLGDILYHGPRNDLPSSYAPKEVLACLNPLEDRIIAVRGNCEAEVDQMVLSFPCMATYNEFWLGKRRVFMTHGHVYSPSSLPSLNQGDVFLSGHTHIATAQKENGIYLLNPGSISLPKNNTPASYALLDEKGFQVYDLQHKPLTNLAIQFED